MGNLKLALLFLALPSCLEAYVTNVCASEYCCSDTSRCMLGQGDCDEHVECGLGLHCGVDNCPQDTEGDMDCCKPKDCKLGPVGSTRPDWECCSPSSPCLQAGEGDCDSDSDCGAGLRCGYNNCGPNDPTGVMDCCTPQPDCRQGSSWLDWRCCTPSLPCGWGQGDCNEDSDCAGELVCGQDNCGRMGRPESHWRMDCCTNTTQSYRRKTTMIQSYTEATTTTQLYTEPTTPLVYKSTSTDFKYYYNDPDYEYVTETTTKYGTEEPTTEYATQEPTTKYTTEEPTTEYSTEEPTTEYTTEELTTEYTTEEPTTEYTSEEPKTENTTKEPTTEYSTEEPTTEYSTEEPTTEYTTEEPTTEYSTEEPITTTTAEYTTEGVTTPEYVTKATTIEYVTEGTTPEYATEISTQEYTTEDQTTPKYAKEKTTPEYANKAKTATSAAWLCPPQKPVLFSSCDLVDSKARCNYGQRLCCGGRPMGHLWQMLCHEDMGIWVGYTSGPCPTDCSLPEGRSRQQGEAPTSPPLPPTPPVSCQSGSFPMCGDDKRNYANECQVLAAGAEPACYGRCPCTV